MKLLLKGEIFSKNPLLLEHTNKAFHDYSDIRWAARESPNRRGVPSWDILAEIWRMAFRPDYTLGYMRLGVGSIRTYDYPPRSEGQGFQPLRGHPEEPVSPCSILYQPGL